MGSTTFEGIQGESTGVAKSIEDFFIVGILLDELAVFALVQEKSGLLALNYIYRKGNPIFPDDQFAGM